MTRTNGCAQRAGVALVLLILCHCGVASMGPKQPIVADDPSQKQSTSTTEQGATATEPIVLPYPGATRDEMPIKKPSPDDAVPPPPIGSPPPASTEVHLAELRGRVETHKGKRLTIEPLVITSNTFPVPGSTAVLWIESKQNNGQDDWREFAEVRVTARMHFGMPMEVDIVEKDAPSAQAQAPETLPRGSRVRIQWAW